MLVTLHSATILQQSNKMSGADVYAKVKVTRKPGHQAAAKLCAGREDDVTYATVKFAEAPSSQQQQQTDPSRTADPTPPVSAAGKASSYRQPALVFLILCCLLLAAIISLAVYLFRAKDTEKYTSPSTNDSSLLNQLQHNNRLSETHSELLKQGCSSEKWMQSNGKCYYFSTDKMDWNSSHDNCTSMGGHLVIIEGEAEQILVR
ncbi:hepatic lectin-like [Acipenser ruthenus]|uniref:hepatic lectin-like n=1 Tax=Acipenser ruthenus TaxID=7906 RepID=UPI002741EE3C|nr:hepatic lectin-like [Acipenser ruthenus]